MNERDRLFLGHVLEAITAIENFTAEGQTVFMADLKIKQKVRRMLG